MVNNFIEIQELFQLFHNPTTFCNNLLSNSLAYSTVYAIFNLSREAHQLCFARKLVLWVVSQVSMRDRKRVGSRQRSLPPHFCLFVRDLSSSRELSDHNSWRQIKQEQQK